jgi:hypothetical protein
VPFSTFALPVLAPRRWGVLALLGTLLALHGLFDLAGLGHADLAKSLGLRTDRLVLEPWRLISWVLVQPGWPQAVAGCVGLGVGMTMASRVIGPRAAWTTMVAAVVLAALGAWWLPVSERGLPWPLVGAIGPVYAAFGMGLVAWWRIRGELTYSRRADWLMGFATIGLVLAALAGPLALGNPIRAHHILAWAVGVVGASVTPRQWRSSIRA